jgi:hypothetical protein
MILAAVLYVYIGIKGLIGLDGMVKGWSGGLNIA